MKHIHKQYIFFMAVSIGIALSGCKKYLDVNKDPNRVTDDNVTPELIFPAAAEGAGATMVGARASAAGAKTQMQWAQSWIGYQAANGDFSRDNTETAYNIDFSFNDVMWQTRYGVLFDLNQTELKARVTGNTALAGASIVLAAKMWQELVDLFGNIPYSQAFKNDETTRPAYDKQQDIYNNLQLRLDTAIQYLSGTPSSKFASADIVNRGNTTKWIKLANTIKLRLLIRQSEISGFNPASEIAKIFAAGSPGVLGKGESVGVNPGYLNDLDKQSPFFANYGYTSTGTGVKSVSSTNANAYIIDILDGSNDPRLARFFQPIGNGSFVGAVYGDETGNIPAGANLSYFGPGLIGEPNADGRFTLGAAQDQWLLPSYESLFLLAEAVARGWTSGDAKAAYEAAVTESFEWLKVPNAVDTAADYMASNTIANWANAGSTPLSKAKFIAFQKYIANTCIDPQESYSDQRRLNFLPAGYISENPSKVSNTIPVRLLYPQSEYTSNSENALKEGTINPFTSKLFWQP